MTRKWGLKKKTVSKAVTNRVLNALKMLLHPFVHGILTSCKNAFGRGNKNGKSRIEESGVLVHQSDWHQFTTGC